MFRNTLTGGRAHFSACCWLVLGASLVLPTSTSAASAVSFRSRIGSAGSLQVQGGSDEGSSDEQLSCSCDCCDVVHRMAGESSAGSGVKCSPNHEHSSDMCGAQCSPSREDKILEDEIVDMERFCFFECKPAAGKQAPDKSQCVDFTSLEAKQILDPTGNPVDPAFLYDGTQQDESAEPQKGSFANGVVHVPPQSSFLSKISRAAQSPSSVDPKKAKKMAIKGKSTAEAEEKDARTEAARLREMENVKTQKLHKALKESGNGVVTLDPFAAIQDLSAASNNARVSAEEAAVTASKAVKAYDIGRQKIWKLSLSEAGKEVMRWKSKADKQAKDLWDAMHKPTWQGEAIKEAQKASKPYIEGMLRAQESVKLYNEKGFAMAGAASKEWKEAQADADAANKIPRTSLAEANMAQAAMLDAREKAKEAQSMALESRQYFATATSVRKGIPAYQYNAQKAAAQAVATFKFDPDKE